MFGRLVFNNNNKLTVYNIELNRDAKKTLDSGVIFVLGGLEVAYGNTQFTAIYVYSDWAT